jgi:hypothetical protein
MNSIVIGAIRIPAPNPSPSPTVAIWSPLSQKRQKQHYIWCSHKDG